VLKRFLLRKRNLFAAYGLYFSEFISFLVYLSTIEKFILMQITEIRLYFLGFGKEFGSEMITKNRTKTMFFE
jgi:hypothetical protein